MRPAGGRHLRRRITPRWAQKKMVAGAPFFAFFANGGRQCRSHKREK